MTRDRLLLACLAVAVAAVAVALWQQQHDIRRAIIEAAGLGGDLPRWPQDPDAAAEAGTVLHIGED